MTRPLGYIIYEGPSRINGDPIVAIATGVHNKSHNPKTGPMVQIYILSSKYHPLDAIKCGGNTSVCGNCPMKRIIKDGKMHGACYVNLGQGPNNIYRSYKTKRYTKLTSYAVFKGRAVRFGAYGDPTAIPLKIIKEIASQATSWTGYTHRWQLTKNGGYKDYCIASCDSVALVKKALSIGWTTFRHKKPESPLLSNETICPNDKDGTQCITCGLCNGKSQVNIVIDRHGATASHFKGE